MTQKAMAELFDVNSQAITKHIGNILEEGELEREATCSKMEQVQQEGKLYIAIDNLVEKDVWKQMFSEILEVDRMEDKEFMSELLFLVLEKNSFIYKRYLGWVLR